MGRAGVAPSAWPGRQPAAVAPTTGGACTDARGEWTSPAPSARSPSPPENPPPPAACTLLESQFVPVCQCRRILPFLLPSFRGTALFPPSRARTSSQARDLRRPLQISEHPPHHIPADAGTGTLEIPKAEFAGRNRLDACGKLPESHHERSPSCPSSFEEAMAPTDTV